VVGVKERLEVVLSRDDSELLGYELQLVTVIVLPSSINLYNIVYRIS
jgi:hypothetical protein